MPGEAAGEDRGKIVEERMDHRLEADEAGRVFLGRIGRKRTEPLVLPEHVVAALGPMSYPEAALSGYANKTTVAKERPEDDLELDRVGRNAMQRGARMFDHKSDFDRGLRRTTREVR